MKFSPLALAAILFFLLANTQYFWTRILPGSWDFLLFLALVFCFFLLGLIALVQLWFLFRDQSQFTPAVAILQGSGFDGKRRKQKSSFARSQRKGSTGNGKNLPA